MAFAAIVAIAAANLLGVRLAGAIGHGLAVAKIGLPRGPRGVGLRVGRGGAGTFVPFFGAAPRRRAPVRRSRAALVLAFFSFGGWWEASEARRRGPRPAARAAPSAGPGVGAVTLLYASVSAVFLYLVPIGQGGSPETFAAQAGVALFGPAGGRALSALVALFVLGSLFAFMTFAPRLYYAMARDGAAPGFVGRLDPRTGAPLVRSASRPRSPRRSWPSGPSRPSWPTSSS